MPENDKEKGGFDEKFGPETVDEIPEECPEDLEDRLKNRLFGKNSDYGDLSSCRQCDRNDPCIDHVISWLEKREDPAADRFKQIRDEM